MLVICLFIYLFAIARKTYETFTRYEICRLCQLYVWCIHSPFWHAFFAVILVTGIFRESPIDCLAPNIIKLSVFWHRELWLYTLSFSTHKLNINLKYLSLYLSLLYYINFPQRFNQNKFMLGKKTENYFLRCSIKCK